MQISFYRNQQEIEKILNSDPFFIDDYLKGSDGYREKLVASFERKLQILVGAKHAIGVNSATDALIIALLALGIGNGDEVIVPSYSFFATASCVSLVGATPVFVDIEQDSYAIDPYLLEKAISRRTRAVIPVHLFCQMADMERISEIARRHNIAVIEDSAEAIGMSQGETHAGNFGDIGVFSFFPTKTLGALGDAGAIVCKDPQIAERCRAIANMNTSSLDGLRNVFASKMDGWHAEILSRRIPFLKSNISRRDDIAKLYDSLLKNCENIKTPVVVPRSKSTNSVYYVYLIEAQHRDELVEYLTASGIVTESYYPLPLHLQPVFKRLGYQIGDCPLAEASSKRAVGLPIHPEMPNEEVQRVAASILQFYEEFK